MESWPSVGLWESLQVRTSYAPQVPLHTAPEWHDYLRQCYLCEDVFLWSLPGAWLGAACLAAGILPDGDHAVLFGVDETQIVRLCSAHDGRLDLAILHPAKAAVTAIGTPLLIGDAPARAHEVPSRQEACESSAACGARSDLSDDGLPTTPEGTL